MEFDQIHVSGKYFLALGSLQLEGVGSIGSSTSIMEGPVTIHLKQYIFAL